MHICLHLGDNVIPWESNNRADFVAQFFFYSRLQNESLEGLMDILAFLVQTLRQNKQKVIRVIPGFYSVYSPLNWGLLAITWAPETSGSRSRAIKIHIPA